MRLGLYFLKMASPAFPKMTSVSRLYHRAEFCWSRVPDLELSACNLAAVTASAEETEDSNSRPSRIGQHSFSRLARKLMRPV